ncbi:MAG: ribonuclease R [Flavobacteriales bacterium]|nr:ribonuclease R [Flavobacteriales bacterium]
MGKKKRKPQGAKSISVTKLLMGAFNDHPNRVYNPRQLSTRVSLNTKKGKSLVEKALNTLVKEGKINEVEFGKYKLNYVVELMEGVIDFSPKGSGYVTIDGIDKDIFIPRKLTGKALQNDKVAIRASPDGKKGWKGEVLNVLERAKSEYVGIVQLSSKFAFFIPSDRKIHIDFFIPLSKTMGAKNGQKVVVRLNDWPDKATSPFAEVTKVLGDIGDQDAEAFTILSEKGFPLDFPDDVKKESEKLDVTISDEEIKARRDFRDTLTLTIDPKDAKDFDDALSFKTLENGNYEIGVHIADVTHYVRPGMSIEREAKERATSVYLVDRVIPMLPEKLSNMVCSLRPHEDKLTFSCVFEISPKGAVITHWVGRTIIHSDRRFTYEEVQEILEAKKGEFSSELIQMNELAKLFRAKRMDSGSIAFDKIEVRFELDETKKPVGVYFKEQKDAHKLIEEFMLLANKTVAEITGDPKRTNLKPKPFVYRVHDTPDPQKLATFGEFIRKFGYNYKFSSGNVAQNLNTLLSEVQGKREENTIENLAIRTMAKAEYSPQNIGHYGLNFRYYTHFTSPIRRYPDMMVHRLLHDYANGKHAPKEDDLDFWCKHSSEQEQKATSAERESTKYFQALFMKDREGEEFDGFVSGISEWGIYVELEETKVEGMIRLKDLSGDYYYFDDKNIRAVGHNTGAQVNLGDKLKIKVRNVDMERRRLDFELMEILEAGN